MLIYIYQRILQMFRNWKNRHSKVRLAAQNIEQEFKPLLLFNSDSSSHISGRKAYELAHKEDMIFQARSEESYTLIPAKYQAALKVSWDGLSDEEKAEWEEKAAAANEQSHMHTTDHIFR